MRKLVPPAATPATSSPTSTPRPAREPQPLDEARRLAGQGAAIAIYTLLDLMLNDPSAAERGDVGHETRRKAAEVMLKFAGGEALGVVERPQDMWPGDDTSYHGEDEGPDN
jgi:hypothetical protein